MPDRHRTHDGALGTLMQPEDPSATWPMVASLFERELGETCRSTRLLSSPWTSRAPWAVSMPTLGELAVKVRKGDRVAVKAQWCALNLPLSAARGSAVPAIIWHGPLDDDPHVVVNLSNVLSDGQHITGIVDWDDFGFGSRVIDLVVLAFDCTRDGAGHMADRLLARATKNAGDDGLRCLVSYRAIATFAEDAHERVDNRGDIATSERILNQLHGPR